MHFVTLKRPGYVLFCTTPNRVAAVALTEGQQVQVLAPAADGAWRVLRESPVDRLSHTEIMSYLADHEEPPTAEALVTLLEPLERGRSTRAPA
jgi:hypothetical protein